MKSFLNVPHRSSRRKNYPTSNQLFLYSPTVVVGITIVLNVTAFHQSNQTVCFDNPGIKILHFFIARWFDNTELGDQTMHPDNGLARTMLAEFKAWSENCA